MPVITLLNSEKISLSSKALQVARPSGLSMPHWVSRLATMARRPSFISSKDDAMNNCSHLDEMFVSTTKTVTQESSKKKDFLGNFSQHGGGGSQSPNFISTVQKNIIKTSKSGENSRNPVFSFGGFTHLLRSLPSLPQLETVVNSAMMPLPRSMMVRSASRLGRVSFTTARVRR